MNINWHSHTKWRDAFIAFWFLILTVYPLATLGADSDQPFDPSNVKINIEHGIELPWNKPGFRIEVNGWLPNEIFSIHAIGPSGEKIALVPFENPLHADEDGTFVVDIDYGRIGLKQGHWMILIGGKPGAHLIQTDLPLVEAPTASRLKWKLTFGNSNGKNK